MVGDHNFNVALLLRCPPFDVPVWHDRGSTEELSCAWDLQGPPGDEHDEESPIVCVRCCRPSGVSGVNVCYLACSNIQ